MSRLLHRACLLPIVTTLLLASVTGLYQLWLAAAAPAKLAGVLLPSADIEFVLAFAPESFHITRLQAIGRVIKVEGRSVFVSDVRAEDALTFARAYWVVAVRPWAA